MSPKCFEFDRDDPLCMSARNARTHALTRTHVNKM